MCAQCPFYGCSSNRLCTSHCIPTQCAFPEEHWSNYFEFCFNNFHPSLPDILCCVCNLIHSNHNQHHKPATYQATITLAGHSFTNMGGLSGTPLIIKSLTI